MGCSMSRRYSGFPGGERSGMASDLEPLLPNAERLNPVHFCEGRSYPCPGSPRLLFIEGDHVLRAERPIGLVAEEIHAGGCVSVKPASGRKI